VNVLIAAADVLGARGECEADEEVDEEAAAVVGGGEGDAVMPQDEARAKET
jgi:hypothetical protein